MQQLSDEEIAVQHDANLEAYINSLAKPIASTYIEPVVEYKSEVIASGTRFSNYYPVGLAYNVGPGGYLSWVEGGNNVTFSFGVSVGNEFISASANIDIGTSASGSGGASKRVDDYGFHQLNVARVFNYKVTRLYERQNFGSWRIRGTYTSTVTWGYDLIVKRVYF